jgi:uncharacterized protein (TIRG00374 family)
MKRFVFLLIGLIVSIVSLYFAFQGFDLGDVWASLARVRLPFFAPMAVLYILTFMTKVWRWRVMFYPDEARARTGVLFSSLMISYIPLPFRAGEVARALVASVRLGIPAPRVFSTILVEKVLDVLTLLLFLGLSLPFVGLPGNLQNTAMMLGLLVLAATLVLLVLVLRPELARKLVHLLTKPLPARFGPPIAEATEHALQGLAPLSNPHSALRLVLWSLATWGINSMTVYLMLLAFNVDVTPVASVVLVVVTNLSMAVPSAPGYIGPFEAAVVGVLVVLGQPLETAQTFAIAYHFIGLAPVATMGVIAAFQQGLGLAVFRARPPQSVAELQPLPSRED